MIIKETVSSSSTALVTGGSGGIGLAIVRKLAEGSIRVVSADITETPGRG
jgi:NAD(P)-dependent dehydrogenase (short-subunit alcohol dehydrogenase family)